VQSREAIAGGTSSQAPDLGHGGLLVIDNYDSFTFNLVQLVSGLARRLGAPARSVRVIRNDASTAAEVLASSPGGVLLSPGPGLPSSAGACVDLVRSAPPDLPIFGVCLGMQILAEAHGAQVVRAPGTMHGRTSRVRHDGAGCFRGLPQGLVAMRYHSWVVEEASLTRGLVGTAWAEDGTLMALRHRTRPIEAVQFHPESFLTEHGESLLAEFVRAAVRRSEPTDLRDPT